MEAVRDLGCVQLDPIGVVARSHQLVLWSRLGHYDLAHLDRLLWEERRLFEYWAHCASIVLTEDYPIHNLQMRYFEARIPDTSKGRKFRRWLVANKGLRRRLLAELRRQGPLPARYFEDNARADWESTGWTSGRNVSQMLDVLWIKGQIMVAGRSGIQKLWDLASHCLPAWTPRDRMTEHEVVRQATQRSLRALGVATVQQIRYHFIRGRYPNLERTLAALESEGRIKRVEIKEDGRVWPGTWYVHADDLSLIADLQNAWEPRTALLSPFDNLICDRARTKRLFDFDYSMEIYVPRHKRKYGYYVLPILHGDRVIGRVDPEMDRAQGVLRINAVYAEVDAPGSAGRPLARAIENLAAFLGAHEILYNSRRVPAIWKRALLA
jgi:hypothetical protein